MCITSGPAKLAKTVVYAGLAQRDGRDVHVMGYQNRAENLADGPNCMILHLPSAMPMSPDNMVDTSGCPKLLDKLLDAVRERTFLASLSALSEPEPPVVHVFNKGIYTVVLANRPDLVAGALHRVPAERRPAISAELLEFYETWFPSWHLALCCFSNREATTTTPLLWWYESMFPDVLLAPAIDCHSGGAPPIGELTRRDHALVFGSHRPGSGSKGMRALADFDYRSVPAPVRQLLPQFGVSFGRSQRDWNYDFLMDVASLHSDQPDLRTGVLGAVKVPR